MNNSNNSNSEYNSNNSELREYSPETRREILREMREESRKKRKEPHPYDKDPIDYPFHNLKHEMSIYKRIVNFKRPEFNPDEDTFYSRLDYHNNQGHIDDLTFRYIRNLHDLKVKMMYPLFIHRDTRFVRRIKIHDLIEKTNELMHILQQIKRQPITIDSLWMYHNEIEDENKTTLLDVTVSIYKEFMSEDIPRHIRIFTDYNKKVLEQFIHYLVAHGADIKHISAIVEFKKIKNTHLHHAIFQGFVNKSSRRPRSLNSYKKHYRSIKSKIRKNLDTNILTRVFVKKRVPRYTRKSIENFL